jgi:hypothetical protein
MNGGGTLNPSIFDRPLDPAHEDEDENDNDDQSEAAGRIVAPAGTHVGSEPMRIRIKIISRMVPSTVAFLVLYCRF